MLLGILGCIDDNVWHCTGGVEQQQETGRKDTGVQLSEIAGLFGKASSRLAEVGYQQFFGPDSTGR